MHGCLHGAWRYTQARLMLSLGVSSPIPAFPHTCTAPRGLHLLEPPTPPYQLGEHVRKGKALGAPSQWQTPRPQYPSQ